MNLLWWHSRRHYNGQYPKDCAKFTRARPLVHGAVTSSGRTMPHPLRIAPKGITVLSIMIIQGPHAAARSISAELLNQLQQLAHAAGRTLELCPCGGLRDFVARVRAVRSQSTEFMLLDPGELTQEAQGHPEAGLNDALDELSTPYIEVHGDTVATLDSHTAPLATIMINGDLGTSYQIALSIALRQLREDGDK